MNIKSYLLENDFKIIMTNKDINVINYEEVESVSSDNIVLKYKLGKLNVKGNDLVIKKLLNDEILIIGSINSVEFRWLNV